MNRSGRNVEIFETDDDLSSYNETPTVYRSRGRSRSRVGVRVPEEVVYRQRQQPQPYYQNVYDELADPSIVIHNQLGVPVTRHRAASTGAPPQANYIPVAVVQPERDTSQIRVKHHRQKGRHDISDTSSSESDYRSSRKQGRNRSKRRGSGRDGEYVSVETAEKLATLRLMQEQLARSNAAAASAPKKEAPPMDPAIAQQLAELKLLREADKRKQEQEQEKRYRELILAEERRRLEAEQGRKPSVPADVAVKLEEYNLIKQRRAQEEAEAALLGKMKEDERKRKEREDKFMSEYQDNLRQRQAAEKEALAKAEAKMKEEEQKKKDREDRLLAQYQEAARKRQLDEQDAIARAEAARAKKEADAKKARDDFLAAEKERNAKAAEAAKIEREKILAEDRAKDSERKRMIEQWEADRKREKQQEEERLARILADAEAKDKKAKKEAEEQRIRIMREAKEKEDEAKRQKEAARKQILEEEEQRKKKEKADYEEMKERVLATEKKKEDEAKAKKKAEDDAYKARVKEQFGEAGFSPQYIEGLLEKKEKNTMAIEAARPTYIRVQIRHVLPETLQAYGLPWEYDAYDDKYLLIKEYISHELQRDLFQHTKLLLKQRDSRLITDGVYTKETVTTLKPNIYKDKDKNEMFLVRRKSTGKSPGRPSRSSWMFS